MILNKEKIVVDQGRFPMVYMSDMAKLRMKDGSLMLGEDGGKGEKSKECQNE